MEEMSKAKNDPNVEQPARDYDGIYVEEFELSFMGTILRNQIRTLRNQELVFEKQKALVKNIQRMERTMSKRHRRQGGAEVPLPFTEMRLPSNRNFDNQLLPVLDDGDGLGQIASYLGTAALASSWDLNLLVVAAIL
ncbi:hypothetical protein Syun_009639 [Stephania yunnanensis]|uniref:Uncharacterized protein n=1 Tax=Stephania yunnanensis TaxID=152371 RepID=A0AAP0PR17_9MAGN